MACALLISLYMSKIESSFFQLLSEAERFEVKEVQEPPLTQNGEKVFLVKVQPSAQSVFGQSDSEILAKAELLLRNKEFLLARNCYSFLLRKNLKNEQAMEGLGKCFFQLREFDSAKKCFKALWELHQKEQYAVWLALSLMEEGNSSGAETIFNKIKYPERLDLQLQFDFEKSFGNLWMEKKQWEKAELHYNRAKALCSGSVAIELNLGTLFFQRKDLNRSRVCFSQALEWEPENSKALCGLGLIELEERNISVARNLFLQAVKSDPQNGLAILCLSQIVESSEEKNALVERIKKYLENDPHHGEIRLQLARLLMEQKQFNESYDEAEKALRALPGDQRIISLKKILIQNRHRGLT